jgi:hypothetical protein
MSVLERSASDRRTLAAEMSKFISCNEEEENCWSIIVKRFYISFALHFKLAQLLRRPFIVITFKPLK